MEALHGTALLLAIAHKQVLDGRAPRRRLRHRPRLSILKTTVILLQKAAISQCHGHTSIHHLLVALGLFRYGLHSQKQIK